MTTKLVIFDMDGLLIDSERIYRAGWLEVFQNNGIQIAETTIASWQGQSWLQTAKAIAKRGLDVSKLQVERENYINKQLYSGNIKPKPYALEMIEYLKDQQIKIGLATSTNKARATKMLNYLELFAAIDYPCYGDEVIHHKPAPEVYLKVLKKADVSASSALACEDSIQGATAAINSAINVVLIPDSSAIKKLDTSSIDSSQFFHQAENLSQLKQFVS
ncbi:MULTISPECIES: HAD family phosphatase [unclassified Enterococcus]|uniref:HAD family hydrolase n=1 Tax=unclassified Enterococcus TaxID=2608891 RepID=UPI0015533FE2|nr:HAD family phosphatase [Enterococcus sp. MMGLQ5-2]MBS7583787.1 HAD family phosphatase [Enterococcus sp. MMGLQ5-1]NPD11648.1 HAD family phosphatase [Enterococcus sp. MMGLQ5-1]NPD36563.1 HAD family phosphatase [Enterococcus sp. MMGLQ5-2]